MFFLQWHRGEMKDRGQEKEGRCDGKTLKRQIKTEARRRGEREVVVKIRWGDG